MISLLDANLLIALFDAAHVHHQQSHQWFAKNRNQGWATCPLTQNACIRIISQPAYPGRLSVTDISRRLGKATSATDHHFWPDSISFSDSDIFQHSQLLTPKHLTDLYLLALATQNKGRLVTFDKGIPKAAVLTASEQNLLSL